MTHICELDAKPLTAEAFAPFGEVLAATGDFISINDGLTQRFHQLATVELAGGDAILSIFKGSVQPTPITLCKMERHPLGSQAFMPLSGDPYLVVVAPAGEFDASQVQAFIAQGQGVNYRQGTWHHYLLPLVQGAEFLVVDRQGEGHNCDEVTLDLPLQIRYSAC